MELRQLRYYVKIVDLGSLSKAADTIHVAQSALSSQITRLEDELGVQLLSRSSRGVAPTADGIEFYRRARDILQQIESLTVKRAADADQPTGRVIVGLPVSVAQRLALPIIDAVRSRSPGIAVCLIEYPSSYLAEQLLNRRVDLALLFEQDVPRGVQATPMISEAIYAVGVKNDGLRDARIPLSALHAYPLILAPKPNNIRHALEQACEAESVTLNVIAECSNPSTMLRLVNAGKGATIIPLSALPEDYPYNYAQPHLIYPPLNRSLTLCYAVEAPKEPALLAVRSVLETTLRQMAAGDHWPGAKLL